MLKVHRFLMVIVAGLSVLLMSNGAIAKESSTRTWEVAENVYRFGASDGKSGYFSMFIVTKEGVIAIEPINTGHAKGLMEAIKNVTDKPVRYLLHSHNHWDHSNGGKVFREQGAKIVAHTEAYEWMKANPHADMALPDDIWSGNRKDIILGGKKVELHYVGMSHGLGMTVFILPEEKMAYIADIVNPNRVLFATVPDFNIKEMLRVLKQVESMDFETAIYAHTSSDQPLGSKLDVTLMREYITDIQKAIYAEFKKGTNFLNIANTVELPKYKHWAMYEQWLPLNVWKVMSEMSLGPYPWYRVHANETQH